MTTGNSLIDNRLTTRRPANPIVRLFGMMLSRNAVGVLLATLTVWASAANAAEPMHPRVEWSDALEAHREIEQWVAQGVPEAAARRLDVIGAAGVQVTLRWDGLTVGRGQWTQDSDDPALSMDLLAASRQATLAAIAAVRQRLEARDKKDVNQNLADIAPMLGVDLQVARTSEPIELPAATGEDAIYARFAPGFHGLVLCVPEASEERRWYLFPADALSRNMNPRTQLLSLLTAMHLPATQLPSIARPGGPALRRFEVIHLVRPGREKPVIQLTRGSVVLPSAPLSMANIDDIARRMAIHLVRRQREDGSMAGAYQPTADLYSPMDASPRDHAFALYAVSRWLKLRHADRAPDDVMLDAQAAVGIGVDTVARTLLAPAAEDNLPAASLALMATIDCPTLSDRKVLRESLIRLLLDAQNEEGLFRVNGKEGAALLRDADQALPLIAIARLYDQTRSATLLPALERGYRAVAGKIAPSGDVAALPLLLETSAILARAQVKDVAPPAVAERAIKALLARQVRTAPEVGPGDVVGGYDLTGSSVPPDWRSAYGLQFLAAVLLYLDTDARHASGATDVDIILSAGLGARFMAQLMFDEPGCFYVRSPSDALGGVRPSLWENSLETSATASALLAVTEVQFGLRQWESKQPAKPASPVLNP